MRKTLIATSALAFAGAVAAAPASAADMIAVGVGGYMEQWIGVANRDDDGVDGGFDTQSDSEIYFTGSMESDMGLKFGVRVQLEANNGSNGATSIDESNAWVSGEFGRIDLGARDPIHTRMHYAAAFGAGAGLNAGDTQKWIPGSYLETAGWTIPGDDLTLTYVTPRVSGIQVGMSYAPDSTNENSVASAPADNDNAVWAAAVNFTQDVGDMAIKVSLGHANVSNPGMTSFDIDKDNDEDDMRHTDAMKSMDDATKGYDDKTFTNAGLSVAMGGFTFAVSYATRDDGGYMSKCYAYDADNSGAVGTVEAIAAAPATETTAAVAAAAAVDEGGEIDCGRSNAVFAGSRVAFTGGVTDNGVVTEDALAADTAVNAMHKFVKDGSTEHDTWAVGIGYADGPLSVSIGHMVRELGSGEERTASEASAGYSLAPGVAWKTSIFAVEDEESGAEGTAFVTGLDIDF